MAENWSQYRFRIVYRADDKKIHWRFVTGYVGGTAFGTVRLAVYKSDELAVYKSDEKMKNRRVKWYCVDPETGMSLAEGFNRQDAIDRARMRLSTITPEQYGDSVYRAKKLLVEAGVLDYSVERGYTWRVQQI